jgi:hypothetical protein
MAEELQSFMDTQPDLAAGRVVIVESGETGYDAVVVYRWGGECYQPPDITVESSVVAVRLEIDPPQPDDDGCPADQHDIAIGIDFTEERSARRLDAVVVGTSDEH